MATDEYFLRDKEQIDTFKEILCQRLVEILTDYYERGLLPSEGDDREYVFDSENIEKNLDEDYSPKFQQNWQ